MVESKIGKVLVVDDDLLQLEVMRDYFMQRQVADIECVSDSQIAADLLGGPDARHLDLIVSDIHMPEVDGIEILHILSHTGSRTPLILASGSGHFQLKTAGILATRMGLNVLGALRKPLEPARFDDLLDWDDRGQRSCA